MLERSCSPRRHGKDYEDTIEEKNDIEERKFLNGEETIEENNDIEEHSILNGEERIEENNDIEERNFLTSSEEFSEQRVEIITGDKPNTQWLLVDDRYFCHLKTKSQREDVAQYGWECKQRRVQNCPYKISTRITKEGGPHEIVDKYNLDRHLSRPPGRRPRECRTHLCYQDPLDAMSKKFRSAVKKTMANDIHAKYSRVYDKEKADILNGISDPAFRERVAQHLPEKKSLRSAAHIARRGPQPPMHRSF